MEFDRCLSTVLTVASQVLNRPVSKEEGFFALGGDSLLAVELLIALEAELDADLDEELLFNTYSFAELAEGIAAASAVHAEAGWKE